MWRIGRYFAVSSAMVLLLTMLAMIFVYRYHAIADLISVVESNNVILANTISRMIHDYYPNYLTQVQTAGAKELVQLPETGNIDTTLRSLIGIHTSGLSVLKVKIYTTRGLTIYSSQASQIGVQRLQSPNASAFKLAAQTGDAQSKLSFRDNFSAFSGEVFGRDVVETYAPLRNDAGSIIGIFELYTDVSRIKDKIDQTVVAMITGSAIVFLILYGVLVLGVMRRVVSMLRHASERAAEIGPQNPRVRLPTGNMPGEILPLVAAVNSALDRLDTALDSQRRFTADAAHELLTPLAVLTANLETLDDRDIADTLFQDVRVMSDIVSQLLELSELEAAEIPADAVADMREACIDVITTLAPIAYQQGKDIELTGVEAPVWVHCCSKSLVRALGNLVKNAIAHTPVNTCVELNLEATGVVHISDKGPGVPHSERERIFDRFRRGQNQTAHMGAGLGLSIVKHVVDACGGRVVVSDATDTGAVFSLYLPVSF